MKLIKLLYLIDRKALLAWGRPVTFDWYYSLPHGPILSFTLDRINTEPDPNEPTYWHQYISERQGYVVTLLKEAPDSALSPAEEGVIQEVYGKFGKMDPFQLRDWCHAHLPEWKDPQGSHSSIKISDILKAEGYSEEDIQEVMDTLAGEMVADRLLK